MPRRSVVTGETADAPKAILANADISEYYDVMSADTVQRTWDKLQVDVEGFHRVLATNQITSQSECPPKFSNFTVDDFNVFCVLNTLGCSSDNTRPGQHSVRVRRLNEDGNGKEEFYGPPVIIKLNRLLHLPSKGVSGKVWPAEAPPSPIHLSTAEACVSIDGDSDAHGHEVDMAEDTEVDMAENNEDPVHNDSLHPETRIVQRTRDLLKDVHVGDWLQIKINETDDNAHLGRVTHKQIPWPPGGKPCRVMFSNGTTKWFDLESFTDFNSWCVVTKMNVIAELFCEGYHNENEALMQLLKDKNHHKGIWPTIQGIMTDVDTMEQVAAEAAQAVPDGPSHTEDVNMAMETTRDEPGSMNAIPEGNVNERMDAASSMLHADRAEERIRIARGIETTKNAATYIFIAQLKRRLRNRMYSQDFCGGKGVDILCFADEEFEHTLGYEPFMRRLCRLPSDDLEPFLVSLTAACTKEFSRRFSDMRPERVAQVRWNLASLSCDLGM
tara:strand:- start:67 stop:1563 length:1497 start_codon:yes stop_codon:yes gene_type:complete